MPHVSENIVMIVVTCPLQPPLEQSMTKYLNALALAVVLAAAGTISVRVFAQGMGGMPGMAPAPSTAPAMPACCGDACKKMKDCCKVDANGKVTCSMGGS